jgi:hypothetical protein
MFRLRINVLEGNIPTDEIPFLTRREEVLCYRSANGRGGVMKAPDVVIIESRSPTDYLQNRQEGHTLQQVLTLEGISSSYFEAVNPQCFSLALRSIKPHTSYVHLSCHGSPEGIQLTDGSFASWSAFDQVTWPVLKQKCLVFSSCEVGRGVNELFEYHHRTFCHAIVAPTRKITWAEGLVAYSAFYHRATRPGDAAADVKVMNWIVGAGTFKLYGKGKTYVVGP